MSNDGRPLLDGPREFWCYWCGMTITGTAMFCGKCGKPVGSCQ